MELEKQAVLVMKLPPKSPELRNVAISRFRIGRLLYLYNQHVCIISVPKVNHHIREHAALRSYPVTARRGEAKALYVSPMPVIVDVDMPSGKLNAQKGSKAVGDSQF